MHLDDEQLQRLMHGELTPATADLAREHLAGCNECRWRVGEAEREEEEVNALLRALDHPLPRIDPAIVAAKAGVPRQRAWPRWAAGVILAIGMAGVAYATPGSPLRAWIRMVGEWVERRGTPTPKAPAIPQRADAAAGIAVPPGQTLVIAFTSPQTNGYARVLLTDGPEVVVRVLSGTAGFTSDVDRLLIANHDSSATFEIQIPRLAPRVEIRVAGERILLKSGSRVTTERATETAGIYILRLKRGAT